MEKKIEFVVEIDLEEIVSRSVTRDSAFSLLRLEIKNERKKTEGRTTELFDRLITDFERRLEDLWEEKEGGD